MISFKQFILNESKFPRFPELLYIKTLNFRPLRIEYEGLLEFDKAITLITDHIKKNITWLDYTPEELVCVINAYKNNSSERLRLIKPMCKIHIVKELQDGADATCTDENEIYITKQVTPENIKTTLLHELYHMLDPKIQIASYQDYDSSDFYGSYSRSPMEFDANSSVLNILIKEKIENSANKEEDIQELELLIRIGITTENIANYLQIPEIEVGFIDRVRSRRWKLFTRLVSRMDSLLQYFKNIYKTKSMIDEY
jgi:Zn-dependent peptidase ImmA (M78 family)